MRLTLSLVTLALAVLATAIVVKVIFPHFSAWQNSSSWVQVDARLIDYELTVTKSESRNGENSIEYDSNLIVNYNYSYKGEEYLGNRLAIEGVEPSDQHLYKLKRIFDTADHASKAITVWVNPKNPEQSTVDRSFRWRGLDLFIAFFIGTGVLGYSGAIEILRSVFFFVNPRLHAGLRKKAARKLTKATTLYDRDATITPLGWGLLIFLFLPIYAGGFRFALLNLIDGEIVLGLVPLLLGGAFIGIFVYVGAKVFSKAIHLGAVRIIANDYPWRAGGQLSGFGKIATNRLPPMATVEFRVGCDQYDHRKAETKKKKLWINKSQARISTSGRYTQAQFDFEIPDDLPSAENDKAIKIDWWIELSVDGYKKETVSKRYDNLGVFQIAPEKQILKDKRLNRNVVTRPGLWDFSTIFLTNGALLTGILVFDWSVAYALLGILIETALIALLSPLLLIGLPRQDGGTKVESEGSNSNYSAGVGLGNAVRNGPFILGLLAFQLMVINIVFGLPFTDVVANKGGVLSGLLHFVDVYNLWLPIAAVFISIPFELRKQSRKSATVNIDQLTIDIVSAPLLRMFFTTLIVVASSSIVFSLDRSDGLQALLLTIVAFKVWIEYSLVRWGRLEI